MSSQRQIRAEKRAEHSDPINFTCGDCKKVHPFNSADPYMCPNKEVIEDVPDESA